MMHNFLMWIFLFAICWPLAIFGLILYPIVWLLLLPFRLIGITITALLDLIYALITLPGRVLRL